jgi:excinuclease ABC subunit A
MLDPTFSGEEFIEIFGAREHNLKNIDLRIPREKLVVITGVSGSGKSSLAFDTLYAEGQRRYMESFSAYARQFIGGMERPDVDKINGLSPVISIEQKTTTKNPRSTVGTITEIYDFLRLLFARTGIAVSYVSGKEMIKQSSDQVVNHLKQHFPGKHISIFAPVVRGRKGHYRELFEQIRKQQYTSVRVDGEIQEIGLKMSLDRYKVHNIEIRIDRIIVEEKNSARLSLAVTKALDLGKGSMLVIEKEASDSPLWFSRNLTDPESGISYEDPAPNTFSFNSPYGACPVCDGLGFTLVVDEKALIPDPKLSILRGAIAPLGEFREIAVFTELRKVSEEFNFSLSLPFEKIPEDAREVILNGIYDEDHKYTKHKFEGIKNFIHHYYNNTDSDSIRTWAENYMQSVPCPECGGARLKKESLHFFVDGKNIHDLAVMDLGTLSEWFEGLEDRTRPFLKPVVAEIAKEIRKRIHFMLDVGLDYLSLGRPTRTLSGGEGQRIRLATQIGSQLTGVLYILDEPSIGLHQRDNQKLIASLKQLRDVGNTVLVVEHDKDIMLESDYLIDIGPGAGIHGGKIVAEGTPEEFLKIPSATADFLSGRKNIVLPDKRRTIGDKRIKISGARGNNLKNVTLEIPLGVFTCITGVSGSGKSSLVNETLFPLLHNQVYHTKRTALPFDTVSGLEHIDKVIEIDQSPIGRSPRSNAATYTGIFTFIRDFYAQLPESKIRGYKPGRFSFNVKGGRCEECFGAGVKIIEMNFLPDVQVHCQTCQGKRYNRETLEVRYKGKSINDVLNMTVSDAVVFFENHPRIFGKIEMLEQVGLGYITLGQPATTLSGGEAQRVKIATELSKKDTGSTLFILDEPTTGLHFQDILKLVEVLQKLVGKGNSVLVIEHNLDVIKVADYVIDLGPEGGIRGGSIVGSGTPEQIAELKESYTGQFLKQELKLINN